MSQLHSYIICLTILNLNNLSSLYLLSVIVKQNKHRSFLMYVCGINDILNSTGNIAFTSPTFDIII